MFFNPVVSIPKYSFDQLLNLQTKFLMENFDLRFQTWQ